MEKKKTKLTISGNPKKSFKKFETKNQAKKTVVIEKQINKPINNIKQYDAASKGQFGISLAAHISHTKYEV